MLLWGDDFTFQNAMAQYKQLETAILFGNKMNTNNIEFIQSTPQTYVNALKLENVEWPVKYDDFMPYESEHNWFWTGYYSSRPTLKKQIKIASAQLTAHSKLFARKVID